MSVIIRSSVCRNDSNDVAYVMTRDDESLRCHLVGSTRDAAGALSCPLSPQTPPTLSVTEALARAVEASPAALAARAGRPIDVGGVAVAPQRPNPDFAFEYDKGNATLGVHRHRAGR